jgi:hypothetical protein
VPFTQTVWSRASAFVSHAVTLTYMLGPITKNVARGFDQVTLSSPAQTRSMFDVLTPQDVDPAGRPGAVVQVGGCRGSTVRAKLRRGPPRQNLLSLPGHAVKLTTVPGATDGSTRRSNVPSVCWCGVSAYRCVSGRAGAIVTSG